MILSIVSNNLGNLEDGGELSRFLRVRQKSIVAVLASENVYQHT